jgi:hypothetical protein
MKILASVCNAQAGLRSSLLLFDEALCGYSHLRLPDNAPSVGMTGVFVAKDEVIVSCQGGAIVVLDRETLFLKSRFSTKSPCDIHSILLSRDRLYAVATGINAVIAMGVENGKIKSEAVYWKYSEGSYGFDGDHVNSICIHDGRILVSAFGKKETSLWSSAQNGFVIDIESGRKLHEGLCQPHTLTSYGGSLLICESAKSRVLDLSRGRACVVDGYVRGLCGGPKGLYAAVSKGRTVSKSTGLVTMTPGEVGDPGGRSAIYLIDWETFEIKTVIEAGDFEFYDLAVVGDEAEAWPVLDGTENATSENAKV